MGVFDQILGGQSDAAVEQVARQFGLDPADTRKALDGLAPVVARGLQQNANQPKGADELFEALRKGSHSRYLDDLSSLGQNDNVKEGNDILGHVFGSKDVSRGVAREVSSSTGISSTILKKLLPVVATMVMSGLGKQLLGGSAKPSRSVLGGAGSSGGILGALLDSDRDGSIMDDVLKLAGKVLF
ncbi:MAG: DUF937 domain-containing protein [Granulosicoccaceae bacterium]